VAASHATSVSSPGRVCLSRRQAGGGRPVGWGWGETLVAQPQSPRNVAMIGAFCCGPYGGGRPVRVCSLVRFGRLADGGFLAFPVGLAFDDEFVGG
jgi:hypothetical protein